MSKHNASTNTTTEPASTSADIAADVQAPATSDHASLDVTAILQHVTSVEASLPPPRPSSDFAFNTSTDINDRPDVRLLQLPRHDRRRDPINFDDEEVDLFLVAARTSRVVGAGLVTVPRRRKRRQRHAGPRDDGGVRRFWGGKLEVVDMGPLSLREEDGDDVMMSGEEQSGKKSGVNGNTSTEGNDDSNNPKEGFGDVKDPLGGDRYGPVTICCAYCEDDDEEDIMRAALATDEDGGGMVHDSGRRRDSVINDSADDEELDEMITSLAILPLRDATKENEEPSSSDDPDKDQRVAIVVGTSFGRILSTELCIHHSRGIRRADVGSASTSNEGDGSDPFEPLPLDYDDEDDMYEYYDDDGIRRQLSRDEQNATKDGGNGSNHGNVGVVRAAKYRFHPEGGVKSIDVYVDRQLSNTAQGAKAEKKKKSKDLIPSSLSVVSVTYGDGVCVRLPHYAFFKSVAIALKKESSFEIPIRRFKISSTDYPESNGSSQFVYLPKNHPSLLSPLSLLGASSSKSPISSRPESPLATTDGDSDEAMDVDSNQEACASDGTQSDAGAATPDGKEEDEYVFCEAATFGGANETLRFHSTSEAPPLLYESGKDGMQHDSSEQEAGSLPIGTVTGAVVGVAAGVLGAAIGAVSWGLGGGKAKVEPSNSETGNIEDTLVGQGDGGEEALESDSAFSRLRSRPAGDLTSSTSIVDPPRKVSAATIDPDGDLMATTDSLGRVFLTDLKTKQVLRIWKGQRDATCCWLQIPRPARLARWGKQNQLYLAIHSGQRRVVEVWRIRHGPRVGVQSVGRGARLIQSFGPSSEGSLARCFVLEPTSCGDSSNIMDSLVICDPELQTHTHQSNDAKVTADDAAEKPMDSRQKILFKQSQRDAMQLQLLKQQLAVETNVPSSPKAIFDTLTSMGSIADLSSALDLLSTAETLEDGMGVQGSSFLSHAVEYCEERLDDASNAYSNNPHLRELKMKITYHKKIIAAYNALNKFEVKHQGSTASDSTFGNRSSSTTWAVEAMAWINTYEAVTGFRISEALPESKQGPLKFYTFSKSCMPLTSKEISVAAGENDAVVDTRPIHLIDSKRDRKVLLLCIFRPLLMDIFVFKVVNSIFSSLDITQDNKILQQYFGEWFMALPGKVEANKDLMVRWLQELVIGLLSKEQGEENVQTVDVLLSELYQFCSTCDDLPRAFFLAAICHEAVSKATEQMEAKTYGKISSEKEVLPWEQLLRKLRVCLLVTLRLSGIQLGSFPVTISNIDDGGIFSIYNWVARDELSISHKHDDLTSMEHACQMSPNAFDPSQAEGDSRTHWERLQHACRVAPAQRRNRSSASLSSSDQPGSLLLYLRGYNHPTKLAAHRALLLGEKWGKDPGSVDLLMDAIAALRSVSESGEQRHNSLSTAICCELWQTRIRPVYRALLFGFEDVPELSEDIMAPLCQDFGWIHDVGRAALDILALISQRLPSPTSVSDDAVESAEEGQGAVAAASSAIKNILGAADVQENDDKEEISGSNGFWPTTKDDVILRSLQLRVLPVALSSLTVHRAIVCATKLTDDLSSLSYCVPSFSDAVFLQGSLFDEVAAPTEFNEYQEDFLNDVVLKKALEAEGHIVDEVELDEIENLAVAWGVERQRLRAQFLLHMYDAGKDNMVNDLANLSEQYVDFPLFVEGGLEISCARLHLVITELKKAKMFRSLVGMLDPDTVKWTKSEAEEAADHLIMSDRSSNDWQCPSLSSTHALVLRILRMSSSIKDSISTDRARSLSILSGTLLHSLQENVELREYGFDWAY